MPSDSDIRRQLEPWGAAEVDSEVSGLRNSVWSIHLHGERYIARVSPRSASVLEWELDLLEKLAGHGFTVPAPVPTASGARHLDGLVVFTFVEGREPEGPRDWQLVGEELHRLHELTPGWSQRPGFRTSRDLVTANTGGDADMSLLPRADAELCRRAWSKLPDTHECVVHGDPSPTNILIDGDTVGLIDWDEARVDSPLLDLGALPDAKTAGLSLDDFRRAQQASVAWEVAVCWQLESDYTRRRLRELRAFGDTP